MDKHRLYSEAWPARFGFVQVAFVVDDVVASARHFARLYGAGPFHHMPIRQTKMMYRGAEVSAEIHIAVAQMGPVQLELIAQKDDTPTIYTRELRAKGGVHHMCCFSPDYVTTRAHFEAEGAPLIAEITMPGGTRVGYFDTLDTLGMLTEIAEEEPGFRAALSKINETCRDWDGTDPVRFLTRDGYRVPA